MDNEKYGIELELYLNKFNQKIQEVKNTIKGVGDKKITIDTNTEMVKREFEIASNQVEFLRNKLKVLKAEQRGLFDWQQNTAKAQMLVNEIAAVDLQLQKAGLRADKLATKLNTAATSGKEIGQSLGKGGSSISKGLDKAISKIKRFGLALLSVRSIWTLVSRASSAYLSQDTELANKLQNVWFSLGAVLAPIIEFIVGLFAKAISVVNAFIKALTGVNLIARATAKSAKNAAGAVKSLNKALASFDELQNLDTEASGGGTGIASNLEDLEDFGDNTWKNFRKWLVGSDKTDFKGILADNIELLKAHNSKVIAQIKTMADILWNPVKDNFIKIINSMLPYVQPIVNEFNKAVEKIKPVWKDLIDGYLKPLWKGFVDFITPNVIDPIMNLIKPLGIKIYNAIVPYVNAVIDSINNSFGFMGVHIERWELKVDEATKDVNLNLNKTKSSLGGILDKLKDLVTKKWSIVTSIKTEGSNSLNNFLQPLRNTLSKIGIKLPYLATGTNYVPEDQLAMIHKGEAVVPKKFNSKEYFGNNDETNSLLRQVIEAVNNIEINPYTTVKDVGKASLSYINSKSRQLGESVVY